MQLVLSLVVIGAVVVAWAHVCVHLAALQERWAGHRPVGLRPVGLRRRSPALRLLPEGHRPTAGLGPLSPSERFLRAEAARGLRDLQLFLVDRAA